MLRFLIPQLCILFYLAASYDLEQNLSPFVIETKQIYLEKYPTAFNPSIILWKGRALLSFRIRDPISQSTNGIGLVFLDEEMNPDSKVYELSILPDSPIYSNKEQDPRLITVKDKLYIVYNNEILNIFKEPQRRMVIGEVFFSDEQFYVTHTQCLLNFEGENPKRTEKNWVPFEFEGSILLSYSLKPHLVFSPLSGETMCEKVSSTLGDIKWDWGVLRGGTPALLVKDQYLAFFHSCKNLTTLQSDGIYMLHYFMGAYTFSKNPPFEITQISPKPIIGPNFYNGPQYKTWKPLRVVFPGGYIIQDNELKLAYGRQDHEMWVVRIDLAKLLSSLKPVKTIE